MDELAAQLARAFAAEHAEHVAAIRHALALAASGDAPDLRDVFRRAHSLKGAARAVDRGDIEELAHALETLLAGAEARGRLDGATLADARGLIDAIEDAVEARADPPAEAPAAHAEDEDALARISTRHVAEVVGGLGELQLELDARALIATDLRETRAEVAAIRAACAVPGTAIAAIAGRLLRLQARMAAIAARRSAADAQVARAVARLERDAERLLLVPAASLADGLERMVRTLAADRGKAAVLTIDDAGAEADRRVLQGLRDPLIHLLRNAIGHGIEPPAARRVAGKPECAELRLEIVAARGELCIAIDDDGAGLDLAAIEAEARRRGLIEEDAPSPGEAALFALPFEQSFSTASAIDRLAGRGVGLAVVAEAARRLHGSASLARSARGGTRATLRVPLAITRQAVLLAEVAGQLVGLPARAIERLARIAPADVVRAAGLPALIEAGASEPVPLVSLAALIGFAGEAPAGPMPAIIIGRGDHRFALIVDALADVRQVVLGDPTAIAADAPLVLGTALAEEGRVALILSADALIDRLLRDHRRLARAAPAPAAAPPRRRTILVVDDSITTRTLERGILEAQGYRVALSVDGLDALDRLRAGGDPIDLVVADVEMPRLDGFGLLRAIRNDPMLADIPVVMMTSRNSPGDIERGLELGADAYVTKQDFEQGTLVATIGRLV